MTAYQNFFFLMLFLSSAEVSEMGIIGQEEQCVVVIQELIGSYWLPFDSRTIQYPSSFCCYALCILMMSCPKNKKYPGQMGLAFISLMARRRIWSSGGLGYFAFRALCYLPLLVVFREEMGVGVESVWMLELWWWVLFWGGFRTHLVFSCGDFFCKVVMIFFFLFNVNSELLLNLKTQQLQLWNIE